MLMISFLRNSAVPTVAAHRTKATAVHPKASQKDPPALNIEYPVPAKMRMATVGLIGTWAI
jgi:hypothetical protein